MKKKLEADLIMIARSILQREDASTLPQLQEEARQIYEHLVILAYTEKNISDALPIVEKEYPIEEIEKKEIHTPEIKKPFISKENKPEVADYIEPWTTPEETRPEIIIERINEKVNEDLFIPASYKDEKEEIAINHQALSSPVFEKESIAPKASYTPDIQLTKENDHKPRSLNDQLKKGIHIGLNNRLAFIKHLFSGSATDYNRVLSQLNTLHSKSEAVQFIKEIVKPDYNNWEGKEVYEERFMEIILNKF